MDLDQEYVVFEGDQTVFINTRALDFTKYGSVVQRLDNLSLDCGHGNFYRCSVYNECQSYVVAYVNRIDDIETLEKLNSDASDIIGFMSIVLFPQDDAIEIYYVCVDRKHRGKKVSSKLLDSLFQHFNFGRAWVGMLFDNLAWDNALRLYVNRGFTSPQATKRTAGGAWLNNLDVLGLTYTRGEQVDKSKTIKIANEIRTQYATTFDSCITKLFISSHTLEVLRKSLHLDREYGGYITTTIKVGDVWHTTYGPRPFLFKGKNPPNYEVLIDPKSAITFHSHPHVCYQYYGCYIGWPSGKDIANMVRTYFMGEYKQYIISMEGVWSLQPTVSFMMVLERIGVDSGCIPIIEQIILAVMDNVANMRKGYNFTREEHIEHTIRSILETFRTYNNLNLVMDFRALTTDNPIAEQQARMLEACVGNVQPFTLFRLQLYPWEVIQERGLFDTLYTPKNVYCRV